MKAALACLLFTTAQVHAGFGGMGNVGDDGGSGPIMPLLLSIAAGAALGALYGAIQNDRRPTEKRMALDGCAIIGGLIGMFSGPILIMLAK